MLGRWRKNDGFKWVRYVPTQIVARRRARKEKLRQAAVDAKQAARDVAHKSVAGIEQGVVQAGALAAAGAVQAGRGLDRGARKVGWLSLVGVQHAGSAMARAGFTRLAGWLAGLLLLTAAIRIGLVGLDSVSRMIIGGGMLAALGAVVPALWHYWGPELARLALGALQTRRVTDGAVASGSGGWTAARAGTLAVTVALAGSALAAVGWGARMVYSAVVAEGPAITGVARVLSAQVVRVGETELRLAGIAAPELEQSCGEGNRRWKCGEDARRALQKAAAGKTLTCHPRGTDEDGRRLARCVEGTVDIGQALVRGGHVWSDKDDSAGYRAAEDTAKTAKAGVWKAASTPPWAYRERLWDEAVKSAPDGCPVKAEGAGNERVYYLPWSTGYQRLRLSKSDVARGSKRWFCTEREAREAGYRPAGERR